MECEKVPEGTFLFSACSEGFAVAFTSYSPWETSGELVFINEISLGSARYRKPVEERIGRPVPFHFQKGGMTGESLMDNENAGPCRQRYQSSSVVPVCETDIVILYVGI